MRSTLKWKLAQGLEIRWWKRYLRKKDTEAYLAWKRDYWHRFLEPIADNIRLTPGQRVLDAGCGPAGIFIALREQAVTALDPLLDAYGRSLDHFDPAWYPGTQFITGPLETFRSSAPFEVVFCLNALNHVSDVDAALDALFGVLAEDGVLVLSIDCHRHVLLKRLFRLIPGDALHPHQLGLDDYLAMIESRGGEVRRTLKTKAGTIFDYYTLVIRRRGSV